MAMERIETITVGSGGAASIEFTNIPQDGVDLMVLLSARTDRAGQVQDVLRLDINNDNLGNNIRLTGDGAFANSASATSMFFGYASAATATAATFSNQSLYISNYTSSSVKSISGDSVSETNGTEAWQRLDATSSNNTSPVTQIKFYSSNGNLVAGSTAFLYKIS